MTTSSGVQFEHIDNAKISCLKYKQSSSSGDSTAFSIGFHESIERLIVIFIDVEEVHQKHILRRNSFKRSFR